MYSVFACLVGGGVDGCCMGDSVTFLQGVAGALSGVISWGDSVVSFDSMVAESSGVNSCRESMLSSSGVKSDSFEVCTSILALRSNRNSVKA